MADPVVREIALDDLKAGLADGTVALVDVREPNEWEAGHVAGARLLPLSRFDPGALPPAGAARIVLHCRSGKRSVTALALAQAAGRTDVDTHFAPGMLGWTAAGEPVAS